MVTAIIVGAFAIGVVGWIWRINLAINHPEKEERLRQLRANTWKEQREVAATIAKTIGSGIDLARKHGKR